MLTKYGSFTDEQLLEHVQQNSEEAFTELYHRFWKKLFVVAANKLQDKAVAEELAQDLLADVWQRRHSIRITTTLQAYMAVSMKYKIIDYLAHLNHRQKYQAYIQSTGTSLDHGTEKWLNFEELRVRLEQYVNDLPEKCRLVYQLSKEQGYKNQQIAQEKGISEKTVEAHLTRALKVLRRKLSHFLFSLLF
ncbi:RNA polymerase sigma-70 factor [Olivibacter ginsenosidimutans]